MKAGSWRWSEQVIEARKLEAVMSYARAVNLSGASAELSILGWFESTYACFFYINAGRVTGYSSF
jgi:hypothetical protein